jgi:predicted ATPase
MRAETKSECERPNKDLSDLVAWMRVLDRNVDFSRHMLSALKTIWTQLTSFGMQRVGAHSYMLELQFVNGKMTHYTLDELSDGERMLVALSVIAAYQKCFQGTTILIDEPDNFVAISELHPWLLGMLDDRPDDGQIILVSHNPEIIQTMGESRVAVFSREDHHSPTSVGPLRDDATGLPLVERLALGWVNA